MPPRKSSCGSTSTWASLDETRGYEPWLYRVTVNVCRDIARGRRHSVGLAEVPEPAAPQPDAYHDAERAQQREIVRRGLSAWARRSAPRWCCAMWKGCPRGKWRDSGFFGEYGALANLDGAPEAPRFYRPPVEEAIMNCSKFETDIALYAGGDLPPGRIARVEAHLGECADCRALAEELRAEQALLGELRDAPLEDAMLAQVRQRVLAEVRRAGFSPRGALAPLLAIAAALVLAVILAWPRHHSGAAPRVAAASHAAQRIGGQGARRSSRSCPTNAEGSPPSPPDARGPTRPAAAGAVRNRRPKHSYLLASRSKTSRRLK
jgi:hypothetical protein